MRRGISLPETKERRSLLSAAIAEEPEALLEAWSRWRGALASPEAIEGADQRLFPIVWRRVRRHCVDDPWAPAFSATVKRAWKRNHIVVAQAADALGTLEGAGIRAVAFKGVGLLLACYEDVSARPTADIDLLVHPRDFKRAVRCLQPGRPIALRSGHAVSLEEPGRLQIDVHRMPSQQGLVAGRPAQGLDALLDLIIGRSEISTSLGRHRVPTLTDLLFLQLINAFAHSLGDGEAEETWIVDLMEAVRRPAFDQAAFLDLIDRAGAAGLFQDRFQSCQTLLPRSLHAIADAVATLPLDETGHRQRAAFSALRARTRDGAVEDPFRALWFALRGEEEHAAPMSLKLAYVRSCTGDLVGSLRFSGSLAEANVGSVRHYLAKGVEALGGGVKREAQPEAAAERDRKT
ncbi:MAG: nucleotidyltransferase family protein [Pseudomonadota bacterium]